MNEQEEDIELGDLEGEEEITTSVIEPEQDKALELDDIGDTLVQLAKRAKDADERDLATQILNSAKFAKKTEFKKSRKRRGHRRRRSIMAKKKTKLDKMSKKEKTSLGICFSY